MLLSKYHLITKFPENYTFYKKVWANIIYFISGIIIHPRNNLLSRKDLLKAELKLRRGDIILAGNLREVSHWLISDPVTHTLLYIGHRRLIHAIADGVQYTSLHHLFTEYDTLAILRLPIYIPYRYKKIRLAINEAKKQIGKPYDFEFGTDQNKFFCSELVNYVYTKAGHETKLKNRGKFRSITDKIARLITPAIKALHPAKFIRGNFELVFLSHNLELKKKKLIFKKN